MKDDVWVDIKPEETGSEDGEWVDIKPEETGSEDGEWVDIKPGETGSEDGEWVDIKPSAAQEPEKKDIGIGGWMKAELAAKQGREVSGMDVLKNKLSLGIDDANENRKAYVEQRLAMMEEDNPIEMIKLAQSIGLDQAKIDEIMERADSGQRSAFGVRLNPKIDVMKQGFAELAKPLMVARLKARESAQQTMAEAKELGAVGKIVKGAADMGPTVAAYMNPITAGIQTAGNIVNRLDNLQKDVYKLDENGNPVLVQAGDKSEAAAFKAVGGGYAEYLVWGIGARKMLGIGGDTLKSIPGVGKYFTAAEKAVKGTVGKAVSPVTEKTAAAWKAATQKLGESAGGRVLLKTGELLGKIDDNLKVGSLPHMVVKSRLTEYLDEVVGLNAREGERESLGEWLDKVTSIENNVDMLLGMIAVHVGMAAFSAHGRAKAQKEYDKFKNRVKDAYGEERAKQFSEEDYRRIFKIVNSPNLTPENMTKLIDRITSEIDAAGEAERSPAVKSGEKPADRVENGEAGRSSAVKSKAMDLLGKMDEGTMPVEDVAIGDVEGLAPSDTGKEIEAYDPAKAKPIVVWEDLEGNRHAVTGGKRLAMAGASGAETVKAVVIKEADGWTEADARSLGATENLREGSGTLKNIVEAVDSIGADGVAELAGWHQAQGSRDFASTIRRGLAVAQKGGEELKTALAEGRIGEDFAYNAAQVLSMERVGEGWEAAQRELMGLVGKVGPEELEAVLWGLRGRLGTGGASPLLGHPLRGQPAAGGYGGPAPLPKDGKLGSGAPEPLPKDGSTIDWGAAIAEERAKYNAKKGGGEGKLDSDQVLIETADGELKTLGEIESGMAERSSAINTGEGEAGPAEAPELAAAEGAGTNRAVELRPIQGRDGAFGTLSHPKARFTVDGEGRVVYVEGLTPEDFAPGRAEATAALVARIEAYAVDNGLKIGIGDDATLEAWSRMRENIKREGKEAFSRKQMEARRNTVVDRLTKSGLATEVVQTKGDFDRLVAELNGRPLTAGEQVYGFCDIKTGKVYLNPDFFETRQGLDAPLHEFGHLGIIAAEKVNKAVYDRGMKLAGELLGSGTDGASGGPAPLPKDGKLGSGGPAPGPKTGVAEIVDFILNDEYYSKRSRQEQAEELLAQLIGKRGEAALRAETNKTVVNKIKSWLVEFWNTFGKALGLKDITPEEAAKMTIEQVADAIRAEMMSGRKYGEGLKDVEFTNGGARVVTKPVRMRRKLTGRRKTVNEFVNRMGGAEDPTNIETDLLALWVDNGGRLFDAMPYEIATGYSKGASGVKKTRRAVADEFAESTAFYKGLDAAQRKVFFGSEKLEPGSIGEGLRLRLADAGITRFTNEDGTVDFEGLIDEFKRQWTNYERGEDFLKERNEWQEERDRAFVEEMERAEQAEYEAVFGKDEEPVAIWTDRGGTQHELKGFSTPSKENLIKGSYVAIRHDNGVLYSGELVGIGPKNVKVKTQSDMYGEQVLKFPAKDIVGVKQSEAQIAAQIAADLAAGRFSRAQLPNGRDFVHVDIEQEQFDGKTPIEQQKIAKRAILKKFRNKIIGEGDNKAWVDKASAGEYTHPVKRLNDQAYSAKMRTSTELDNLMATAKFKGHNPDDGRHPKAKGGWDHYEAIFEVGGRYYTGDVALMVDARGRRRLHDVTQIKEETLSQLTGSTQGHSAAPGISAREVLQGQNPDAGSSTGGIIPQTAAGAQGGVRWSRGGIFTGTAADYANRSRQGGVEDTSAVGTVDAEKLAFVDTPLSAKSYREAREILKKKTGRKFTNAGSGLAASLSGNSINKILSGKAVAKSIGVKQHLAAAANIVELFEGGELRATEEGNRKGVKNAKRVFARFDLDGEKLVAKITVLEHERDDHRIYSVEAMEVSKAGSILAPKDSKSQAENPALPSTLGSIPQTATGAQGGVRWSRGDKAKGLGVAGLQSPRETKAHAESGNSALQWLQSPRGRQNPDFVHSIADEGSPVKGGIVSQTATRQFKNWFGGSKVVDANGEPLVVWHGGPSNTFTAFDPARIQEKDGVRGFYFSPPDRRDSTAGYYGHGGERAFYLNIRNPLVIGPDTKPTPEELKSHDGIIRVAQKDYPEQKFYNYRSDSLGSEEIRKGDIIEIVAFEPNQVKSATDNIGTFDPGNADIRFLRGGSGLKPPEAELVKTTRVADDAGVGEQTPGAIAASRELSRQGAVPLTTKGTRYVSLPLSEMNALARYLTGHAMPGEMASGRKIGAAGKASMKNRKLMIAADVLGTIDKSDMAAEKAVLKQHGYFAHEDAQWAANHSPEEMRAERERSDAALSSRLEALADRRAKGKEPGGQTAATRVYADQLAKIVMTMPHGQPGVLGAMQTVAGALEKRVRGNEAEAEAFLDWMEGGLKPAAPRSAQERKAEMFAAFLMMPKEMETRAKGWYDAIRSTIAADKKLAAAFREMTVRMMTEQGYGHLQAEIMRAQDAQTEAALKKLNAEAKEPIKAGDWRARATEAVVLSCDDRMGAAMVRVDAATRNYLHAQKLLMNQAKTAAERAAIKQQTDIFIGEIAQAKNQVELSRTAWERGHNNVDARYLWRVVDILNEATVRDGLKTADISLYMDMQRVIETKGLSGSRGMSARQAQIILDTMKKRLGGDYARIEAFAQKFHAIHEQELLNDPALERVLGKGAVEYWKSQAHYVTTKRQFSPEELAEIEAARRSMAQGATGMRADTVIGQMYKYAGRPDATAKLKGSFADKQEVMSATLEKVAAIKKWVRKNDYVIELRDLLVKANIEGVHDFAAGKNEFPDNSRYGSISYMENGQKRTLVVPSEIAHGFRRQSMYDNAALKLCAGVNNIARQLWIDWNPVYWQRNIARNAGSIEMNMQGMREAKIKRGLRLAFPGLAPVTEMAMTHLVRHMPERWSLPLRRIWGEHTALFLAPKAKRMAMWLTDHNEMQRRLWEAERRGDLGAIQEMEEDRRDMLAALRANMLVGISAGKASGTTGFLDDSVKTVGKTMQREALEAAKKSKWRKALDTVNIFERNAKQQVFEDIMAKFTAYLHDRAQFGKTHNRTAEESGLMVKKNVSIGEGERKGGAAGTVQAYMQPFWNMVEKGVVRNVKAYGERTGETLEKAAWRIAPMILHGLIGSGAVAAWILKANDGDEEKVKNGPMGDVYDYLRDAQRAYQNCSNYVRENYHVTPLMTDGYTSVILGMPLTDEERLLKPIARFVTDAASVASGTKESMDLAGFMSDVYGTVAPDFKMAGAAVTLLDDTAGALIYNPDDYYTGGTKYDKDLHALRNENWGMRGRFLAAMGKRLWNDFGGRNVLPVDRAGVDNGLGKAPGWVAKMVNAIPVASPILRSFVKVQVGSPRRDAAEITEAEAKRRAIVRICSKEMFEAARREKRDLWLTPERYTGMLEKWQQAYGLSPDELAQIEAKYLNAWRAYEGAQYRADGEREKFRAKAEELGLKAAGIWLDWD